MVLTSWYLASSSIQMANIEGSAAFIFVEGESVSYA